MPIVTDADRDRDARQRAANAVSELSDSIRDGRLQVSEYSQGSVFTPPPQLNSLTFDELLRAVPVARKRREDADGYVKSLIASLETRIEEAVRARHVFQLARRSAIQAMEMGDENDLSHDFLPLEATKTLRRAMDLMNGKEIA